MKVGDEAPLALVLGAGGLVGGELCRALPAAGWRVLARSHVDCDVRNADQVRAACGSRPAVIFNAAAYTNVDRAESEPDAARAVNAEGAEIVARAAAETGAKVVHYSTDFVFDGEQERPYVESDPPSPMSAYARSKAEGDARVTAAAPRHFILRVGCVYGRSGRNFASTVLRRLKAGEPLRMDAERRASPTWVREVAAVSIAVATTDAYGLYHCTADGETTWFEFARHMAAQLALRDARIEPVTATDLASAARRPRRAILENRRLRAQGLDGFGRWDEVLRRYLEEERASG